MVYGKYTIHSLVIVEMKRRSNNMATHNKQVYVYEY